MVRTRVTERDLRGAMKLRLVPVAMALLGAAAGASAQTAAVPSPQAPAAPGGAGGPGGTRQAPRIDGWSPQAQLSLGATFTDNALLSARGSEKSDVVLRTAPTIGLRRDSSRFTFDGQYSPVILGYLNDSREETLFNTLRANATLEVLERFFYVDSRANIAQTFFSPFGAQPSDVSTGARNRTEVRTLEVSPYLKGRFAQGGSYQVRHDLTHSTFSPGAFPDITSNRFSAIAKGEDRTFIVPSADYTYSSTHYGSFSGFTSQIARARATMRVDPEFSVFLIGGYETADLVTRNVSGSVVGGGFTWSPTTRTKLDATSERRYYGNSYVIEASHQTRLTLWRLRASRSEQLTQGRPGQTSTATTRALLDDLLRFTIPDPTARAQEVERRLQAGGGGVPGLQSALLSARVNLIESIEPSFAINGVRNTLVFSAFRRETTPISDAASTTISDPFLLVNGIRQTGWSINETFNFTDRTSGTASIDLVRTTTIRGAVGNNQVLDTRQRIFRIGLSHQLAPLTTVNGSFRWSQFDFSELSDARERALLFTFTHSFYQ